MQHLYIQREKNHNHNIKNSHSTKFLEILKQQIKMATTRLLKMSATPTMSNEILSHHAVSSMVYRRRTLMCLNKAGLSSDNPPGGAERKPVAVKAAGCASACVLVSEPKTDKGLGLALLLAYVADAISHWRKFVTKQRSWGLHIQMFVEKAIIDCRFFTLLAIAGSLVGSVLCFVEGSFLIVASYLQYFHALSQVLTEQGQVMIQLIEAIDMFLMGTAMLVFAMALHVMFVGQNNFMGRESRHSDSTLPRNGNHTKLPSWLGMDSAMQAKSKIGHAVIMILQIQVLDKFKSIAVSNGMDLACFAGAIFLSSASIFLLSRISIARAEAKG